MNPQHVFLFSQRRGVNVSIVKTRSSGHVIGAAVALGMGLSLVTPKTGMADPAQDPSEDPEFSVLVFSKTAGFRHGSIPAGIKMIEDLGEDNNFSVDVTENGDDLREENLDNYDALVWLRTTCTVLKAEQREEYEDD